MSRFLRTSDGGATWQDVSPGLGSHFGFWALDAQLAWVRSSENDELWRTRDGGQTWTLLAHVDSTEARLDFVDNQTGWAVVVTCEGAFADCNPYPHPSALAKTTDGGQTWQILRLMSL